MFDFLDKINDFVESSIQMISTGEKRMELKAYQMEPYMPVSAKFPQKWSQTFENYLVGVESCGTNELFFNFVFKDGEKKLDL